MILDHGSIFVFEHQAVNCRHTPQLSPKESRYPKLVSMISDKRFKLGLILVQIASPWLLGGPFWQYTVWVGGDSPALFVFFEQVWASVLLTLNPVLDPL